MFEESSKSHTNFIGGKMVNNGRHILLPLSQKIQIWTIIIKCYIRFRDSLNIVPFNIFDYVSCNIVDISIPWPKSSKYGISKGTLI